MRPLTALRGRLARVPASVLRYSEAAATRTPVLADVRAVFPEIPRDADADRVIRHARRLVLDAARDEFAREGVALVSLPEGWGRAELRRADIAGDAAFRGFVEEVITALDIAPGALERDDALELRDGRFSSDRYGFSLETSADLASYLLSRAWLLTAQEMAEAAADSSEPRAITAGSEPAPADEQEFFEAEAARLRDLVRARLERLVRVPLELRAAVDRHERLEDAVARAGATGGRADGDPRTAGTGQSAPRPGAEGAGTGRRARDVFARRASSAAYQFARSEAGRTAFSALRGGAERAYDRYGRRGGSEGAGRRDGDGPRDDRRDEEW